MTRLLALFLMSITAPALAQDLAYEGDTPPTACGLNAFCTNSKPAYTQAQLPLQLRFVGDPPPGLSRQEVRDALERAARTWTEVPCSFAQVRVGEDADTIDEVPAFGESPTSVAVLFADPNDLPDCAVGANMGIIAFATCFDRGREIIAFNTRDFTWAMAPDFTQQLTDGFTKTPRTVDLPSVATHELGHTLGLSHTNQRLPNGDLTDCGLDLPLATMSASYLQDGGQATLAADDRLGLCSRYPNDVAQTCAQDTECAASLGSGSVCVEDQASGLSVCQEPRSALGEACSIRSRSCALCFYAQPSTGDGFCTQYCDAQNPCPQGFECDASLSASGNALCVAPQAPDGGCCGVVGGTSGGDGAPWWGALGLLFIWRRRSRA